jgi:hypothetical protein
MLQLGSSPSTAPTQEGDDNPTIRLFDWDVRILPNLIHDTRYTDIPDIPDIPDIVDIPDIADTRADLTAGMQITHPQ